VLPRLVVITDWSLPRERLLGALEAALSAGPEVAVQHRHPGVPLRQFLEEARVLSALCARHARPLFVNGRLDVALLVGAHQHLPAGGLRPADVRPALPEGRLVSVAVHDAREAADSAGADLALVSPVYAPGSKPDDTRPPLGPAGYAALRAQLRCPALALGGIDPMSAAQLTDTDGFAAISGVLGAEDPAAAARMLLTRGQSPLRG
jgi:thiamine-phosphate pyrophosphorylase